MNQERIEEIILNQFIHNEDFFRNVYPFFKAEYFGEKDNIERILFEDIQKYVVEYNKIPNINELLILINEHSFNQETIDDLKEYTVNLLNDNIDVNYEWLYDKSEAWCKDKSLENAILSSIEIIQGVNKKLKKDAIPEIVREALSVSFDASIGLDFNNDLEERFLKYDEKCRRVSTNIEVIDKITDGGFRDKTLNCILAGTGVGKSMFMCSIAANALRQGYNVLYITLEMSEEDIAKRIDANILNVDINQINKKFDKNSFVKRYEDFFKSLKRVLKLKKKNSMGNIIIKEYPTSKGNVNHFRALINELSLKKQFSPDLVIVDYINICSSVRITLNSGSYAYVKAIAEELRGFAVEYKLPVLTATQTTRGGQNNNDLSLSDTSESIGLPQTLDLFLALFEIEEFPERMGMKQLKNRYKDLNYYRRFVIGVDKPRMKFYHVDECVDDNTEKEKIDDVKDFVKIEKKKNNKSFKGIVM